MNVVVLGRKRLILRRTLSIDKIWLVDREHQQS